MTYILQSYETPPFFYLLHASVHCQRAMSTYIKLWKDRNSESTVIVSKNSIFDEYGIEPAKFKQDLLSIVDQALANVHETSSKYVIEMTDWEEMKDELC